ncbi:MAG: hypothetical protein ABIJ12_03170 [bacterium]
MRKWLIVIVIILLVIFNAGLLWQNYKLKLTSKITDEIPSYLTEAEGRLEDLRGIYTYPGIGAYFVPKDEDSLPVRSSLTMVIFLSESTTCPMSLGETEVYRRLLPKFRERGQQMVAMTTKNDSVAIAKFLADEQLDIPLLATGEDENPNLEQIGISHRAMPFKVLYDSTFTSIYMRGANNTPASQADFESAVLWLSALVEGE